MTNVQYAADLSAVLDEYLPSSPSRVPTPALILVHGGAWTGGDKSEWSADAANFTTATGWPAFTINYDLSSATPFLTEPQEVTAAVNWVKSNSAALDVNRARLGLVGDSAGGHLALLAGMTGSGPSSGAGRVAAVVSWSGPSDLGWLTNELGCLAAACNTSAQWVGLAVQHFEGGTVEPGAATQWAATSPISQVDPTDPKALLFNSTGELVPLDQMTRMASALSAADVPVKTVTYRGNLHAMSYNSQAWPTTLAWLKSNL